MRMGKVCLKNTKSAVSAVFHANMVPPHTRESGIPYPLFLFSVSQRTNDAIIT
jgi:hypothetical protein